jgi:hypothetical protein
MFEPSRIYRIFIVPQSLKAFLSAGAILPTLLAALVFQPTVRAADVQLLAPPNGANFALNASVFLSATVSDPDGIDFVDFMRNGTSIGRAAKSPGELNHYSLVWIATQAGSQTIAVRATDLLGNVSTSPEVTITVGGSQPPTDTTPPSVQMLVPANNSTINSGATVTLIASATDSQSSITFVDFHRNGTVFARGTLVPGQANQYSATWLANASGQQSFSARAVDSADNASTSSAIMINVINPPPEPPPNIAPSIAIVAPSANATLPLSPITLSASVSDSDGTVRKVEFFANNDRVGSRDVSNTQATISLVWRPRSAGTYQLTARASDNSRATTTSSPIQVTLRPPDGGPTPPPAEISAVRSMPKYYRPWHPFEVEIKVTANTSWQITEKPPKGWRVIGVSNGGKYSEKTHTISFSSDKSRTVKYHLFSPRLATGTQVLSGTIAAGSKTMAITGVTQIAKDPNYPKRQSDDDDDHGDDDDDDDRYRERNCIVKIKKGKRGHTELRFTGKKGGRWIVEFCDSVAQQNWKALPNGFFSVIDQHEFSIEDPDESAPLRFYRLRCLR